MEIFGGPFDVTEANVTEGRPGVEEEDDGKSNLELGTGWEVGTGFSSLFVVTLPGFSFVDVSACLFLIRKSSCFIVF